MWDFGLMPVEAPKTSLNHSTTAEHATKKQWIGILEVLPGDPQLRATRQVQICGARQIAFSMLVIFREHKPAILR